MVFSYPSRTLEKNRKESRLSSAIPRVGLLLCLLHAPLVATAERHSIKLYTTEDGLPSSHVTRIVRDSRGYLWFCTVDGLARFDGYNFKLYGAQDGLSHPGINDLLETRAGVYWVGTNGGGIFRFNPHPSDVFDPRFIHYAVGTTPHSNTVNVAFEDHTGRIWAGTDGGLFVFEANAFAPVALEAPAKPTDTLAVFSVAEDAERSLWLGGSWDLLRLLPDAHIIQYTVGKPLKRRGIGTALSFDRAGNLWMGSPIMGLFVFNPEPAAAANAQSSLRILAPREISIAGGKLTLPSMPGESFHYSLANNRVTSIRVGSDGRIWVATYGGLLEFDQERVRQYALSEGSNDNLLKALEEDRSGNLWIGTETNGAMRLARGGFVTYTDADGLGHSRIASIFEDRQGELCVTTVAKDLSINRFEGGRFRAIQPRVRPGTYLGWGWNQLALQDRTGEWWIPTGEGLYRYGKGPVDQLSRMRPKAVYKTRDGLGGDNIFRLFEDSRGDIWITTLPSDPTLEPLTRWDRSTGRFHTYPRERGQPHDAATAFCEDRSGHVWLGFYTGGVARCLDDHFVFYGAADGVPSGQVRAIYLDGAGRLWMATNSGGLGCIVDPETETPTFKSYTVATGLVSNNARCVTEDQWGRIYVGTARGVDRLDVSTGAVWHYSTAEGLASAVLTAYRDRRGWLWFGTLNGLSRLIPEPDQPRLPSPATISAVRIGGIAQRLSELGESEVSGFEVASTQNQVQIDFSAVGFGVAEALKYQFMLEGVDQDWSMPADQRTVNYARLAPGRYRFLVRSINSDMLPSATPAIVGFTVLPPLWQRWWFLTSLAGVAAFLIFTVYRYRVARLIEIERVRTRIASDLHDDIGSSLSQIAILSEVLRKQVNPQDPDVGRNLSFVARISREAVDSMSDIVWAVNPEKDYLRELVRRMRRFLAEVFPARNIEFTFKVPSDAEQDLRLGADTRRQVFLIFKEAVNNILRHSGCSNAIIELKIEGRDLVLTVHDNGRGFNSEGLSDGHGLISMKRRADRLVGELRVTTQEGSGTLVTLRVPSQADRMRRWSGFKRFGRSHLFM